MRITHQETIGNVVFQEFAPVSGSHALQCEQTREARFLKKLEPHVDDWEGSKVVPGDDVRQELATREISPRRHNLLKWFHFAPDATLLEIGCGLGGADRPVCGEGGTGYGRGCQPEKGAPHGAAAQGPP